MQLHELTARRSLALAHELGDQRLGLREVERAEPGGEGRELTVLFADLAGFTALSERLSKLGNTYGAVRSAKKAQRTSGSSAKKSATSMMESRLQCS